MEVQTFTTDREPPTFAMSLASISNFVRHSYIIHCVGHWFWVMVLQDVSRGRSPLFLSLTLLTGTVIRSDFRSCDWDIWCVYRTGINYGLWYNRYNELVTQVEKSGRQVYNIVYPGGPEHPDRSRRACQECKSGDRNKIMRPRTATLSKE